MSDPNFSPSALPHLSHLRQALVEGRASVMVGAGFSRNAIALDSSQPVLPTWWELSKKLVAELAPSIARQKTLTEGMGDVSEGYMRLAQYFEAKFGRIALDRFITNSISDSLFAPDTLHTQLLNLTWREVFTTNWDTLLERSADLDVQRLYFPVADDKQILTAGRPRITKLHGCVQRGHYIFTEEDYRTYPQRHPVLVTVVRQALLEGPMLLIGFSGEDPNFRSWVGWMRDVLPSTHPVYLLDTSGNDAEDFRVQRLRDQGVIVIQAGTSGVSHADRLKEVLSFLNERPRHGWERSHRSIKDKTSPPEEVEDSVNAAGESYRGWLICPRIDRSRLDRHFVHGEIDFVSILALGPARALRFFANRVRLLDVVGFGVFNQEMPHIDKLLQDVAADPALLKNEGTERWLSLAFSRLATARLSLDLTSYQKTRALIVSSGLLKQKEVRNRLVLSDALLSLVRLDLDDARDHLVDFSSTDPHLQLRALVLKIELGDRSDIKAGLQNLRRKLARLVRERPDDVRYASLEDALRRLEYDIERLNALNQLKPTPERDVDPRADQRLALRCDTLGELFFLETILESPPLSPHNGRITTPTYRAGTYQTRLVFNNGLGVGLIPAYLMARCPDDAGLLIAADDVGLLTAALEGACRWLIEFDIEAGFALALRLLACGREAGIKALNRFDIARLPDGCVAGMLPNVIDAIQRELTRRCPTVQQSKLLSNALELASKLAVRIDAPHARRVWALMFDKAWANKNDINDDLRRKRCEVLVESAHALDEHERREHLRLQVKYVLEQPEQNENLALLLVAVASGMEHESIGEREAALETRLIELLASDHLTQRRVAIYMIGVLWKLGLVDRESRRLIGDALWSNGRVPEVEFSANAVYFASWHGSNPGAVRAHIIGHLKAADDDWKVLVYAEALSWWKENDESRAHWQQSLNLAPAELDKVRSAFLRCTKARISTQSFGMIDCPRVWRNVLCRFLAPMDAIRDEDLAQAIALAKKSDLWMPSIVVELLRFHLIDGAQALEELLGYSQNQTTRDWDVDNAIFEILTSEDSHLAAIADSLVFLNELSGRIKRAGSAEDAHAMWIAVRLLEDNKGIVPPVVSAIWSNTVAAIAQKTYTGTTGAGSDVLPDLRRAAARLLQALRQAGAIDPHLAEFRAAHSSFAQDPLPEVRAAAGVW